MAGILVEATQEGNWKHKKPYSFYIQDHDESNGDNLYAKKAIHSMLNMLIQHYLELDLMER